LSATRSAPRLSRALESV